MINPNPTISLNPGMNSRRMTAKAGENDWNGAAPAAPHRRAQFRCLTPGKAFARRRIFDRHDGDRKLR